MNEERLNFIRKLKQERKDFEEVRNADHGQRYTKTGNRCSISREAVIGTDGFGYEPDEAGRPEKFPHYGKVIIGNYVTVGSCTCIDRGNLSDTVIGDNTKIDNLVHISHNVRIGANCLITAGTVIGGSAEIGDGTQVGLGAIILPHIKVGKGCLIGAGAVVTKDVHDGQVVIGNPAKVIKTTTRHL